MSTDRLTAEQIMQKVEEIPTLPTIVYELNKIISDPMSSTSDVEAVMENDPSITGRVLKLVNSAYYAIPGGVSSLSRAIAYLGFDTVQQLVLTASVMDVLSAEEGDPEGLDVPLFWQHSMGVAMASETIAKHLQKPNHADLFTCGLLHDLGKMALHLVAPAALSEASGQAIQADISLFQAETELKLVPHTDIGFLLTKRWQLPSKIQMSAQHHHQYDPPKRKGVSSELSETVDVVILANLLTHALKFGASGHQKILPAPKTLLARLQIPANELNEIVKKIKSSLANADAFLKIIGGET